MEIVSSINHFKSHANTQPLIFIPTMGSLHEGHFSLIRIARNLPEYIKENFKIVISIFINPLQMDNTSEFKNYPRNLENDLKLLKKQNVDFVFTPSYEDIYVEYPGFKIIVPQRYNQLEGIVRSDHFNGVATIISKLFNIIRPKIAIFGKKDYQQLLLVQDLINQMFMNIKIIASNTIRDESTGLALSSRNFLLNQQQKNKAGLLYKQLIKVKNDLKNGNKNYFQLEDNSKKILDENGWKTDYLTIRNKSDLTLPDEDCKNLIILAAAKYANVRLIDNLEV